MANDRIGSGQLVAIREARVLATLITREEEQQAAKATGQPVGNPPPPIRKWLYIFSSDGADYGLKTTDSPRMDARRSFQHMAPFDSDGVNPPKSSIAGVDRVEREVYFDWRGLAHELSIATTWQKPRHQRPHPIFGKAPSAKWDELEDKLEAGKGKPIGGRPGVLLPPAVKGKPRRYYLLLSPIRLGPKALQFAKDNPDALTIYYNFWESTSAGKILGPQAVPPKNINPEGYRRDNSMLAVVDPYAFAERIRTKLLAPIQDQLYAYLTSIDNGDVRGVDKRHFQSHINRGTISELVSLANIVSRIQGEDQDLKDLIDQQALEQVLGIHGNRLESHVKMVEKAARFYANWLTGPQHQTIDLGVVEDLKDTADETAAVDKAAALSHWFCQFRAIQATGQGAGVISQLLSDKTPIKNPMRDLFLKYASSKPAAGSTDLQALHAIGDLVPDLALYVFFQFGPGELDAAGKPDPDKAAPARAKALADLVNNIQYFNTKLGTDPNQDPQKDLIKAAKKTKYAFKSVLYAIDSPIKNAQWVAEPFKNPGADLSSNFFRRSMEKALGFEPVGGLLKRKNTWVAAESSEEYLRRTALQMEQNIADLRQQAHAMQEQYTAALVKSVRVNPVYTNLFAFHLAAEKEMTALDREISRVGKEIDKVPYDVVGRADGPALLTKRHALISELETRTLRKLELRRMMEDAAAEIENIEQAARNASVDLKAARDKAVQLAGKASSNYDLWKKIEAEKADDLKVRVRVIDRRIQEVTAQNLERQKALKAKGAEVGPIKVYASAAFLLLEFAMFGATMSDQHASDKQRRWAYADLGKGFVDLGKDYLSLRGIKPELLPTDARTKLFIFSKADAALLKEASALRLKVASGVLGVLGGLHTVVKYGPDAAAAWRSDDTDAALFAGLAAFGGVVSVVVAIAPFLGFMTVSAASGIGAVASLVTAIGILVYLYVADSEHEKVLKNCYFAKKQSQQNYRFADGAKHWMGPPDPGARENFWGVREQLAALTRLSARFEVSSLSAVHNFPTQAFFAEEIPPDDPIRFNCQLVVDFNAVPAGARIFIDLRAVAFGGQSTQLYALSTSNFESGAKWNPAKTVMQGVFAPPDRPGFILISLKDHSAKFFRRIAAFIEYTLPDGSTIKHDHTLIEMKIDTLINGIGEATTRYYAQPEDGATFATSFHDVPHATFP
jgi:hypothetical protein